MSGTSLDGLDLAYCILQKKDEVWSYSIVQAQTIEYSQTWRTRLKELPNQPMFLLPKTDAYFGKYIGQCVKQFINTYNLKVDYIASHGHTIFHNPNENYSTQIGSGAAIYAETNIPTIVDFRSVDVALGGQGAPLVPVGDSILFSEYDGCLNLGGFANISFTLKGKLTAFDIAPCNLVLNEFANQLGFSFDSNGELARIGELNKELLFELNALPFYHTGAQAKSLGREWVEQTIYPLIFARELPIHDILRTLTEHIAIQVSQHVKPRTLITGGGAYNSFLLERINELGHGKFQLIKPDGKLINYKEALIFALLGCLRIEGEHNALSSVTGATKNSIGGCIYG